MLDAINARKGLSFFNFGKKDPTLFNFLVAAGRVIQRIEPQKIGAIKVQGVLWKAMLSDGDKAGIVGIEEGELVQVVGRQGLVLIVTPYEVVTSSEPASSDSSSSPFKGVDKEQLLKIRNLELLIGDYKQSISEVTKKMALEFDKADIRIEDIQSETKHLREGSRETLSELENLVLGL